LLTVNIVDEETPVLAAADRRNCIFC